MNGLIVGFTLTMFALTVVFFIAFSIETYKSVARFYKDGDTK